MKNSLIFKLSIVILLFNFSCSNTKEYEQHCGYGSNLLAYKAGRKNVSGTFICADIGFVTQLRKGRLNGVTSLIDKGDTILYCRFVNNKPVGVYINRTNNCARCRNMILGTIFNTIGAATGRFNKYSEKDGYWNDYYKGEEGYYTNGIKNGYWKECYSNDIADGMSYINKGFYKNGQKDSLWILEKTADKYRFTERGFYKHGSKEGSWEAIYFNCVANTRAKDKCIELKTTEGGNYYNDNKTGNWIKKHEVLNYETGLIVTKVDTIIYPVKVY